MTNEQRDRNYEVVWSGEDNLIGDRDTRTIGIWTPPRRLYNWSGKYKGKFKGVASKAKLDNSDLEPILTVIDVLSED